MSRVERNQALYNEPVEPVKKEHETQPAERRAKPRGAVFTIAGTALMLLIVFVCLSLMLPRLIGYETYVIVSGSMEPAMPVGSLVYSHKADPATLQEGDVVVFVDPSRSTTPITHRVVVNDTGTSSITTKGDANERQDVNPVAYENIKGKVLLHVPHAGFLAATLTSLLGKITALLILLEAWLLLEIGRRLKAGY